MSLDPGSAEPIDPRPTFRLVVKAEPSTVPAILRLRRLLKALLRAYGFWAVEVSQLPESRPDGGPAAPRREAP
jgi:hypothetical protein